MRYISYACLSLLLVSGQIWAAPAKAKAPKKKAAPAVVAPAVPTAEPTGAPAAVESHPVAAESDVPYGMAGCGLGSLIIKSHSKGPQIGAFFLNVIGYQSFAITTGSSNCVHGKAEVAGLEQKVFVTANLSSLSKEAAQGGGEHLNGLAEVFGCSGDELRLRLGQLSQEKFDEIFAVPQPEQVLEQFRVAIHADPLLAPECVQAG